MREREKRARKQLFSRLPNHLYCLSIPFYLYAIRELKFSYVFLMAKLCRAHLPLDNGDEPFLFCLLKRGR